MKLQRAVECITPARLGKPPRSRVMFVGMMVGVIASVFGVAGIALSAQLDDGAGTKPAIARAVAKQLAERAYAAWRVDHREVACPGSITDLGPYTTTGDTLDPWGNPYEVYCSADSQRVTARSIGEDGKRGTPDDIWSHL